MIENNRAITTVADNLFGNLQKVLIGKRGEIEKTIIALLCNGHILIEDVPGVGKTILAKSIAKSINCKFNRIQFTPDLLPSDLLGVSIYDPSIRNFEFKPGPIFCQVLLADEINRATPKTQSALLEAMEEHQFTVDGVTRPLPFPFLVFATQNPIEYEGTFPLPEAQLDRFMMRISLGYPAELDEDQMLSAQQFSHPFEKLSAVCTLEELEIAQRQVKDVYLSPKMRTYIIRIVRATRNHTLTYLGASPRGSLFLAKASQAKAAISGRDFVIPDDIREMTVPVLGHRIMISSSGKSRDVTQSWILEDVVQSIPIPDEG